LDLGQSTELYLRPTRKRDRRETTSGERNIKKIEVGGTKINNDEVIIISHFSSRTALIIIIIEHPLPLVILCVVTIK
jgi:hypothetical protein